MTDSPNVGKAWRQKKAADVSPQPVVRYLDTMMTTSFVQNYKRRTYQALHVRPGMRLLDVGCGTGDDVLALAELVGRQGKVIGVDEIPAMVDECRKRLLWTNLSAEFQLAEAHTLPFADETFDGCRSDRAVQHMEEPLQVIKEMVRVAKKGGRVVISEPDWDTFVINSSNRDVTRRLVYFMSDKVIKHGWLGRQLSTLFKQAGLEEVSVAGDTMILTDLALAERVWGLSRHAKLAQKSGVITAKEMDEWMAELETADRQGYFFSSTVGFMASGRKPV